MYFKSLIYLCLCLLSALYGENQTADISPVYNTNNLPFEVRVELADFQLPQGLSSFIFATHNGEWILLAGRTSGMHGFGPSDDNFPIREQNTQVFIVNPSKKTVLSRSLKEHGSGFSQTQIDLLSVTAAQWVQIQNKIYMVGGYGINSSIQNFDTKPVLTIIDIPKLIDWVKKGGKGTSAFKHIEHPLLQVTGGVLYKNSAHDPFLLIAGQNYKGFYHEQNGVYTEQIRTFDLIETKKQSYIVPRTIYPQDPNYRRRDLNVVPIIKKANNSYQGGYAILGGVFTLTSGAWTVPILIEPNGKSSMLNPSNPLTLKQGLSIYIAANLGLYSAKREEMYTVIFGGLNVLENQDGIWVQTEEDPEKHLTPSIPFANTITTIKIDRNGNFTQHVMDTEYPVVPATFSNIGNPLLFGTSARFVSANQLPTFNNGVFALDTLKARSTLLGYIVGGIASTLSNTHGQSDSSASPYIFTVTLEKK